MNSFSPVIWLSIMMIANVLFYLVNIIITTEGLRRIKRMEEQNEKIITPLVDELKALVKKLKQ